MRSRRGFLAALPFLILASARATTTSMTMHALVDDKAVHGVAFRYLAPQGWKSNAVLNWSDNVINPTQLMLSANSPDGRFLFLVNSGVDYKFDGHAAGPYGGRGYQNGKNRRACCPIFWSSS